MTATITLDQMKDKLVPIETLVTKLQKTEPLSTDSITNATKVAFRFQDDWAADLDPVGDTVPVQAFMSINGTERQMTKEAAIQAAAAAHVTGTLLKKAPADLMERTLNYFYAGNLGKEMNALSVGDYVSAFTRPTLVPFSNLQLLERSIEGIQKHYGNDVQVWGDYKFANSLNKTDVRLVIGDAQRTINDTHMKDVPSGSADVWMSGVHLSNSLTGKGQTCIESYMFRWWCTNGATTELDTVGKWSRRSDGQQEDVYDWARDAVDEVLGGMEERFQQVQALAYLDVAGNTADVLREIFQRYGVPVSQREAIMDLLLDSGNLSMYSIMQAITRVANDANLKPSRADDLMRIGGALPTSTFDTLKAKVWREGHKAKKDERNPYEPVLVGA